MIRVGLWLVSLHLRQNGSRVEYGTITQLSGNTQHHPVVKKNNILRKTFQNNQLNTFKKQKEKQKVNAGSVLHTQGTVTNKKGFKK